MRLILSVLILALVFASPLQAGITGKISGRVTDKDRVPLPAVNVVVVGTTLGAVTDVDGNYVIINVPPGSYALRMSLIGYTSLTVQNVAVMADRTTTADGALTSSAVQLEDVVIQAERPMVQRDLTASMAAVTADQIKSLPVRNFVEVLQLQAGVVGEGSSIHIRGGRSGEISYLIDGMSVRDPVLGTLGTTVNNDAISEMNLLTGTFSAEYGNAMSGVVNIVTKEGGSTYHGNIEGRTSEFGVDEYARVRENRVSASVSGPILGEDVSFFGSGERDARGSWLPFGYERVQSAIGKLSARIVPELKLVGSWRYSEEFRQSYNHEWKYIPTEYLRSRQFSRQGMVTITHSALTNLFYSIRFSYLNQYFYSGLDKDTSMYLSSVNWTYLPVGTGVEFYAHADPEELMINQTETFNAKGDVVWAINSQHEIKGGFEARRFRLHYFNIYDPKRNFPYITNFQKDPLEASGYLLDKIELNALVINLGLRLDYLDQQAPFRKTPLDATSIAQSQRKLQWSPRLGVAHPITENTSFHFAYGKFFQVPDYSRFYENAQYDISVREPLFGQPNLDAERTTTYEVGVNHQVTPTLAVSLVASYKDVTGLVGTQYYAPYVDGRFVGYTIYVNEAYANIKGIEVHATLRRTNYLAGSLNYTYSVSKGSASSQTEDYPGTTTSTLLYPLNWDKTHMLNVDASLAFPANFGPRLFGVAPFENTFWNFILRASSGYPYTPSGRDVGFVAKNSARLPMTYSLDAELMKEFHIAPLSVTFFVEVLNLTGAKNVVSVFTDTGEPDRTNVGTHSIEWMHDPSNYGPPRRIRLGLGLRF